MHAFRSAVRLFASNGRSDWNNCHRGHDSGRLFKGLRCRCNLQRGYIGDPYPAVYRNGRLCSFGGGFSWADVPRGSHSGAFSRVHAYDRYLRHG